MGEEDTKKKDRGILNDLLEKFVDEVNNKNQVSPVDFVVYNGDLVWAPSQASFDNFTRIVAKQEVPVKLVHGNHDGNNDDPKFLNAQKKLSGYQALNYSFDYGNWHFIVIAAQEKYKDNDKKKKQLAWIRNELEKNKNKQVMLFMHYHLMPVGLSQLEYYTYRPKSFKLKLLDEITKRGNVKYVFNGHVHVGVKASIKSSLEYKGTKFINAPTTVMARPFGEEFIEFENNQADPYYRKGYYLEVQVNGDDVKLIGKKINHEFQVTYPNQLKEFSSEMDKRFFMSETEIKPNAVILNSSFEDGFIGWEKSYRYEKDIDNAFQNTVENGSNVLKIKAPWGKWTYDEYMETYQLVELDLAKQNMLSYELLSPNYSDKGAGGYIKLNFYNKDNKREKLLLLHWGSQESKVKYMPQSWFYNSQGDRGGARNFEKRLISGKFLSFPITFDQNELQRINIDLGSILKDVTKPENITKMTISHGVWSSLKEYETDIYSQLEVKSITLFHSEDNKGAPIQLNERKISWSDKEIESPYFNFKKNKKKYDKAF